MIPPFRGFPADMVVNPALTTPIKDAEPGTTLAMKFAWTGRAALRASWAIDATLLSSTSPRPS